MDSTRRGFLAGASLTGAAALTPAQAQTGRDMHNGMSPQDVRKALDLSPNATCGYVRVTYVAKNEIAAGGMQPPFADKRPVGSGLYFMVTPDEPVIPMTYRVIFSASALFARSPLPPPPLGLRRGFAEALRAKANAHARGIGPSRLCPSVSGEARRSSAKAAGPGLSPHTFRGAFSRLQMSATL